MVSIIIPTYNEAQVIGKTLEDLRPVRGRFEVIVADGESTDSTPAVVAALGESFPRPLRVIVCERNRAQQLNQGARVALGEILLFLHADAKVEPHSIEMLERSLQAGRIVGGNFDLVFEGESGWDGFFTWANRVRRHFGIYYGDSGLFVRRRVFDELGGFKPIPIMDDYEFVRRMERQGPTVCLPSKVWVSDRRWRVQGVLRTVWTWVLIQGLYSLGVSAEHLARWYKPIRSDMRSSGLASPRPGTAATNPPG